MAIWRFWAFLEITLLIQSFVYICKGSVLKVRHNAKPRNVMCQLLRNETRQKNTTEETKERKRNTEAKQNRNRRILEDKILFG